MTNTSRRRVSLIAATFMTFLAGCATPPPRQAIPQEVSVKGASLKFGGPFDTKRKQMELTVNDEPVMRGTFPPFTPTLNMSGEYRGTAVRAECYASSNLSSRGGGFGAIATAVQGSQGKSSDACKIFTDGTAPETTLYF